MRIRARPGSSGERHLCAADGGSVRSLERAATREDEQWQGHALEEHIRQRQQLWQPARLSCRLQPLQPHRRPPLKVRKNLCSIIHAQRAALSRPSLANPLILDVCSNSVGRVRSEWWCARVRQTGRCGSSSTSRWCAHEPASSTSAAMRCCGRTTWQPVRAAELCAA